MPRRSSSERSERVLVWAPFGRDGTLIGKELLARGVTADVCSSVEALTGSIREGAGVALIADEALTADAVEHLRAELAQQPPWSDFPLVVMTSGGESTGASRHRAAMLEPLGNVSLLERPLRTVTLVSTVRAALRARRHQYQLEDYVREREESERELEKRNEELSKANRRLEEFAFVSSHDLQEPLRMVKIYAQLLVRRYTGEDPTAQQYVTYIEQGITRMENLLRDVLTFSRTVASDDTLREQRADLSKSLAQAITTLNGRIEESAAKIDVGSLPVVMGDETQLAQVFQNLLSNALKYRQDDRPPKIVVSAEQKGPAWLVSVSDNGIGFEQKYADRIFGLFKRLHNDKYEGTGLGLAICQRIVERYGGRIWAESNPGQGATFRFTLPGYEGDDRTAIGA